MEPDVFWNNVKSLIKAKGVTQEWVCNQCNIPLGTMKNGIVNSRFPSLDNAYKIASCLETTVEFLLTGVLSDLEKELSELKRKILEFAQSVQ